MPIYTYQCENCGVQFEKQQKFDDLPLNRCPECGKKTLKKIYQPVGIVFKGSGFYATDHHSPSGQSYKADKEEEKKEPGNSREVKEHVPKPKKESEKASN
jgi:putative FmdB family regulatory protein